MTAADALAAAYRHGPGRVVETGPAPRPGPASGPRTPFAALAARGRFGSALTHLLTDVVTPLRWEPWNQYNDHRGHPSARAAFTVDVVLAVGSRRWLVDPVRRVVVGDGSPVPDGLVRLEPVRRRDRLAEGYGEFGDALTELEMGHVAAALVEHASRLGLRAHADGTAVVVSSWRESGRPAGPSPVRGSGFGPRGISADPRPLPVSALHAFVAAITHPPEGSPVRHDVRHRLAVRNVEGVADGWYEPAGLRLVDAGGALDQVREVFGHPPDTIDVGAMNLALVTTGDPAAAVAVDGPDGYRALLRAAGAAAQHACTAAAGAGMFCRPARSTVDGALEAAVRAPASHVLLYLLLAGRPRGTGFSYDLTPLEAR
ncbi:hypothetical protein [Saccharothrix texasensis]|uniref:Nitroreductase family protein n=1 Tax=Saccharothrix texasensis TaxID=103734 RepID=A0A3N1GXJ1_9PSEU|nr:hypothetical protein [Saccharothrix texasensis]ROP34869.1 hypothetical protein EDD40_0073 [Saccharothrix texasensis]